MRQAGFTLIEIIAVLVILGILAAVAIPKYQDLQQTAAQKAAAGAVAAAQSALSLGYSKKLLENNGKATGITDAIAAAGANCGVTGSDFTVACGNDGKITATHIASEQTATGSWALQ